MKHLSFMFMRYTFLPTLTFLAVVLATLPLTLPSSAARAASLIRDAEIETTIRTYVTPIFVAAGLEPDAVKLYLVQDKTLNAFVAGGQNIFIHTGLLMKITTPNQLIGVIAHETGHIQGGHLSRIRDAMEKGKKQSLITTILGAAAAIGTGRADVGVAAAVGGQEAGMRTFLKFSRGQESTADQAALRLLDATGQSAEGTLTFLDDFGDQELLSDTRQDPYLRTHPLTRDRIDAIRAHVEASPFTGKTDPPAWQELYNRMLAKLSAFLDSPASTLRQYKKTDPSVAARYARAIAYYRKPDLATALVLIDELITEEPSNPYFHELKGQMLFENGRGVDAIPSYQTAARLLPRSALIHLELASAQIETNDATLLDAAIKNLNTSIASEPDTSFTWRQLAVAYGRRGDMAFSSLSLAEEAVRTGARSDAIYHAGRAEKLLEKGSGAWLRARDILDFLEPDVQTPQ